MKIRTSSIICIVLLIVGAITSTQFAHSEHERGNGKEHHHSSELMDNLSEDQVKQIESLRLDLAKKILPLKAEMEVKHLELKQLWMADAIDEKAILAKTDEALQTEAKIRKAMTRHKLDIAKLLTKEQREWLLKEMDEEHEHWNHDEKEHRDEHGHHDKKWRRQTSHHDKHGNHDEKERHDEHGHHDEHEHLED